MQCWAVNEAENFKTLELVILCFFFCFFSGYGPSVVYGRAERLESFNELLL